MATLEEFKALRAEVAPEVQKELLILFSSDPETARQRIVELAAEKGMTSPGVVALACVQCASGYSVPTLSHLRAEPMSKEQLDAVRDQLLAEKDNDLRQTFLNAFLEDAEKGAGMIINYEAKKGLKLDESPKEVIEYIGTINDEDIDIEMTPEMLAAVSGGIVKKLAKDKPYDERPGYKP